MVVDPLNSFASSSPVGIPWNRTFIEWPLFSDFRNLSLWEETKQHDLLERTTIIMEDDDAVKAHTTNEHLLGKIQTSQTWKIGLQQPLDISI